MLTNEQCIKVAEKIWGWEKVKWNTSDPNSFDCWIDENRQLVCDDTVIGKHASKAVNSWAGFGRTLEAMAERGYTYGHGLWITGEGKIIPWGDGGSNAFKPDEMIEATHLAALEALNDLDS